MPGGGQTTTNTSTSSPWGPSQDYLKGNMKTASDLSKAGTGFNPYTGPTVVPFSSQTQGALSGIQNLAQSGNPLASASMSNLQGILNGQGTVGQLQGLLGQSNQDAFNGVVDQQAGKLTDDINRSVNVAGRDGSMAHSGQIADQVGAFRSAMATNQFNQNIANQRGILGDIAGLQSNAISAAPGVYDQQYAPYERLAQVGAANEDLTQRQYQSAQDIFNQQQQAPWQRLAASNAIYSGAGQLGSSQSNAVAQPGILQQILGGATLGAGILGGSSQNSILGGLLGF